MKKAKELLLALLCASGIAFWTIVISVSYESRQRDAKQSALDYVAAHTRWYAMDRQGRLWPQNQDYEFDPTTLQAKFADDETVRTVSYLVRVRLGKKCIIKVVKDKTAAKETVNHPASRRLLKLPGECS